jgi:drug/metabolite transporter (DMT)-like permease
MAARNYSTNQWKGYLFIILAVAMWGTNGVAAKYLFSHGMSPSMLVQIRSAFAFFILFTVLGFFKKESIRLNKRDLLFMVTFAIGGISVITAITLLQVERE